MSFKVPLEGSFILSAISMGIAVRLAAASNFRDNFSSIEIPRQWLRKMISEIIIGAAAPFTPFKAWGNWLHMHYA